MGFDGHILRVALNWNFWQFGIPKFDLLFFWLISWEAWAAAWLNPDMQARRGWNEPDEPIKLAKMSQEASDAGSFSNDQ